MAKTEPFKALERLEFLSRAWPDDELGTQAQETTNALNANPAFQQRLAASKFIADIRKQQEGMKEAKGAESNTWTDAFYYKRNSSKMMKMKKSYEKLVKKYPETPEVAQAKAILTALQIPLTKEDYKMFKLLQMAQRAKYAVRARPDVKAEWENKKFYGPNKRALETLKAVIEKMKDTNAEHSYTAVAIELGKAFKVPMK